MTKLQDRPGWLGPLRGLWTLAQVCDIYLIAILQLEYCLWFGMIGFLWCQT